VGYGAGVIKYIHYLYIYIYIWLNMRNKWKYIIYIKNIFMLIYDCQDRSS
jgi:hypothetical protein